jgi:hypothetical protein
VSRVQLVLNGANLDDAVTFYTAYFRTPPSKVRPGYANFAIDDPPLKLILIEGNAAGSINHLGVEVFTSESVRNSATYFDTQGLQPKVEESTTCCYAVQDKVWVDAPDGLRWETYVVLANVDDGHQTVDGAASSSCPAGCC